MRFSLILSAAALACGASASAAQRAPVPPPPAEAAAPASAAAPVPQPPAQAAAAAPAPALVPFANEVLRYSVNWPSGLSLGEGQMIARRTGDRWSFAFSLDAAVPGFVVSDMYQSTAAGDFCSAEFVKTFTHGKKKTNEKVVFDARKRTLTRTTLGADGGTSESSTPACARDALTFLYYLRRELSQGRTPPPQTVFFGAAYQVRFEFGGAQKLGARGVEADRVHASVKGPASEISFDLFFAHDAARTPLQVRVPFPVGTLTMELVR